MLLGICLLPSCGKREVQLSRDMRRAIDTLAAREINVLRPQLDSLCAVWFDSLVTEAADSILDVRIIERQTLIGQ